MNKQLKRGTVSILSLAILSSIATTALAAQTGSTMREIQTTYGTVRIDQETLDATSSLNGKGIVVLMPSQTPFYQPLSRWEASMLTKRFSQIGLGNKTMNLKCSFPDLNGLQDIIKKEVLESCEYGIFKGSDKDGKFYPFQNFTRGQTVMVMARILARKPGMELNESYDYLLKEGIIHVDDRAKAGRPVPRYELYLMMHRYLKAHAQKQIGSETATGSVTTGAINTDDKFVVSFDDDKNVYVETDVPLGTAGLFIKRIAITNNSGEKSALKDATFTIEGFLPGKDIEALYLVNENGETITNIKEFNKDGTINLEFKDQYKNNLVKNGTTYFYLTADFADKLSSDVNTLQVKGEITMENNDEKYTFHTEKYHLFTYQRQDVTVLGEMPSEEIITVGATGTEIGTFNFEIGKQSDNDKDMILRRVILTNNGEVSLQDVIDNVVIKDVDGNQIGTGTVNKDTIKVMFKDNFVLKDGDKVNGKVYADIVGGNADTKINLYVKHTRDIVGREIRNKLPTMSVIPMEGYKYAKTMVVKAGKLFVHKDPKSPTVEGLAKGATGVELLRFKVTTPSKLTTQGATFTYTVKNGTDNEISSKDIVTNLKLVQVDENGKVLKEVAPLEVPATQILSGQMVEFVVKTPKLTSFDEGLTRFAIVGDVSKDAKPGVSFKMVLNASDIAKPTNAKGMVLGSDTVDGTAESGFWTIASNDLTISYATDHVLDFIKGKSNVNAGRVYITTNNVEDVKLTDLRLKFATEGSGVNLDAISNIRLYATGDVAKLTPLATVDKLTDGYASFKGMEVKIPKREQAQLQVVFDTSSKITSSDKPESFTFAIESSNTSDITVVNMNGATVGEGNMKGIPMTSEKITVQPVAKLFMFKDQSVIEPKVVYNKADFTNMYKFRLKSQFDNVQVKDMYVVAYDPAATEATQENVLKGTQKYVANVKLEGASKTLSAPMMDGIVRFDNLNDIVEANKEVVYTLKVRNNDISAIENDNHAVKLAIALEYVDTADNQYKTKFISLTNNEDVTDVNSDIAGPSQKVTFRKGMITVDAVDAQDKTLVNGAEHTLYQWKVTNKGQEKVNVKQFALPIALTKDGSNLTVKDFKLEISNDGTSWTPYKSLADNIEFSTNSISDSATVLVSFVGDTMKDGLEIPGAKATFFRVKATVEGATGAGDVVRTEMKAVASAEDGTVGTFEVMKAADGGKAMVVWTDNADADGSTSLADANWFEDYMVEGSLSPFTLSK